MRLQRRFDIKIGKKIEARPEERRRASVIARGFRHTEDRDRNAAARKADRGRKTCRAAPHHDALESCRHFRLSCFPAAGRIKTDLRVLTRKYVKPGIPGKIPVRRLEITLE